MTTINDENKIDLQLFNESLLNNVCWLNVIPYDIFEIILGYLNGKDISSLSQTCRNFYALINNDQFWNTLIYRHFSKSIAQLYTIDLFKNPDSIEIYNEIQPSGIFHLEENDSLNILAIHAATHYNDEAVRKRHVKMHVSKDDFLNNVEFFQFKRLTKSLYVPFYKIIYFYLIDRKRCAAADMYIVDLNEYNIVKEHHQHSNTLTGTIVHLHSARIINISGRFEHKIMPGKYEVSWRIKADIHGIAVWGTTEFIVVPQSGRLLNFRMIANDFYKLLLEKEDSWSMIKMGYIIIYEPSTVLIAVRNWNSLEWKYGLLWDCIELTLIP